MNIEQLNQSGQQLRVFFITTILALLVTGAVWFCVDQIKAYVTWRQGEADVGAKQRSNYSIIVRAAMIVWLVKNGHATWMLKSRAWQHILRNSQQRPEVSEFTGLAEITGLSAGDMITRVFRASKSFHGFALRLFETNPMRVFWETSDDTFRG